MIVKPKEAVLDPQGNAVRDAMRHLGMPEVRSVRIGKFMEIDVDGADARLEKRLHGLCRDLLSNPVIEDYELQKSEVSGSKGANFTAGVRERESANRTREAGDSVFVKTEKPEVRGRRSEVGGRKSVVRKKKK